MTPSEYETIVAGYPALKETERKGYEKLCALCLGPNNQDKVLQYILTLKDYQNDVNKQTTLHILMDYLDDNDIHFIMGLDWRSAVEDLDWRIAGALKQNFGLELDLPKLTNYPPDASISFDHVFTDFDAALRNEGYQMSIVNEGSDGYNLLVHQIADKTAVEDAVKQIGYFYDDFTNYDVDYEREAAYVKPPQKITQKKESPIKYMIITLLCPFFTYIAYKGYLKEGVSLFVVLLLFCNLLFYWFGIYGLVLCWKERKQSA